MIKNIVNIPSDTLAKNSIERQMIVDTNIHLHEDPIFNALVVSDFLLFDYNVQLDLTDPYETYNKILSLVGHFNNGHIIYAAENLYCNYHEIKQAHNIRLPKGIHIDNIIDEIKSPYANVTPFDIAEVLFTHDLIHVSPNKVFEFSQKMVNDYKKWILDSLNGHKKIRLVNDDNQPLFGLKAIENIEFKSEEDFENFWIGTAWALGVMDNFHYRAHSNLKEIGGGICLPVNLQGLTNAPYDLMHDLKTLSQMDVYEILNLSHETPLPVAEELFYEKILPPLLENKLILKNMITQDKDNVAGYVRIKKGPGTSDFMSIGFGWLAKGKFGSLGILLGDAEDTAQVLAEKIYFNGQDEAIFNELMLNQRFKEVVEPYLQPEWTRALINWSYEDPNAGFPVASCSQSYQSRLEGYSNIYTTLRKEQWFFQRFGPQFNTGTISKEIPRWPIGFERAPSRQFFDYILKKAHNFRNRGIFPQDSWIYSNT